MGFLSGKSKTKEVQTNAAAPQINAAVTPLLNNATSASNAISNLLGLNGSAAQNTGFENYKTSTGYEDALDTGSKAITGNAASRGMLNSGATLKALDAFGQNLANTYLSGYLDKLMGVVSPGLQAGGLIGSTATKTGTTTQSSKPGLGSLLSSVPAFL